MQIQFGRCRLDLASRQLHRGTREVHLSTKAFELLKLLVENRPRALAKVELIERIWPSTFVSEDSLARLVAEIRSTIGDRARQPRWVRTVHGFGYAFSSEIHEEADASRPSSGCVLTWASQGFRLTEGENVIGRDPDVAVLIDAPIISRRHARIVISAGRAELEDLGSKNGTYVGMTRVTSTRSLDDGDQIRVGDFTLTFRAGRGSTTETRG